MSEIHVQNIHAELPERLPEELIQKLLETEHATIERIVSHGHASPADFWYDQETTEWVMLVSGEAVLRFEGQEPIRMKPGDYITIPAHVRHRVEWTTQSEQTVWLAVHVPASTSGA